MHNTRVDDMLIEMITPKMEEIERRFSSGEGLSQDDINTLLLKSQYNHINHLDQKLNEVTADVASLKSEFDTKFNGLKGEFNGLKGEFNGLKGEFALLKSDIEVTIQKALNKNMMLLITVMGIFLILSKIIDKF
jgi:peptidoglycan hydrolase CwlO-like protein